MITAVAVVIPIHNEQAAVQSCLASVLAACDALPACMSVCIVPALDSCTDGSAEIAAAALAGRGDPLHMHQRSVGRARHAGIRHALSRLHPHAADRTWIASTDGDSTVPRSWLLEQLMLADAGFDAVAGTIQVSDWRGHSKELAQAFERFYAPEGCSDDHTHVHGTNLGMRADAYESVGGFPDLETGEDHALWNALRSAGRRMISTRRLAVTTSARLLGRAPHGFADFLARLSLDGARPASRLLGVHDSIPATP